MRLTVAVHRYQLARRNELAPSTRRNVRIMLGVFAAEVGPDLLVRNLRRRHVEHWLATRTTAPATTRANLSIVRTFCRWCVDHGHLKADPTAGVKGPRQPVAMPRELSAEEVERVLAVLPDRRAELIVFLGLVQGMRRAEIAGQLRENIDLTGRMMLVHGKGNKERWLPIVDDTAEALFAYLVESPGATGPLIRSVIHPHRGVSPGYLTKLVRRWMGDAGVKAHAHDGRSLHALRHTRAGTMLDDGADIRDVQEAFGHGTLGPTYVYLRRRLADGRLRDAMGRRRYRAQGDADTDEGPGAAA